MTSPPPTFSAHEATLPPARRAPRVPRAVAQPALQAREQARRRLVRVIMLIYLLAIFEGALRKWVAPQLGQYLYFIRDPFLLWAYLLATRHGLWPRQEPWLTVTLGMAVSGVLLVVLQAMTGGASDLRLILGVHGLRSYFLYVPLAFLIGGQFHAGDLQRLYKLTLWLAVPIAVLVTLQFFSPPGAPINVGISSDEAYQFKGLTATAERTRPMGPFASGAGQAQFVGTAWAIALGLFIAPAAVRRMNKTTLLVGSAALMVCAGLSGSRGTIVQCGLAVMFALLVGIAGRGAALKGRALAWTVTLVALALVLYPILLPEGFAAFTERWNNAARAESGGGGLLGRALFGLIDFVFLFDRVPLLGYGLGYGSNASITLQATIDGMMPGYLAETDFSRHMVDLGPVFGLGYIGFRLALIAWLVRLVLQATRQAPDPMPMLLLSYVAVVLFTGQITGNGAINVYGWLFTGVLIAACRRSTRPQTPQQAAPGMPPRRPRLALHYRKTSR